MPSGGTGCGRLCDVSLLKTLSMPLLGASLTDFYLPCVRVGLGDWKSKSKWERNNPTRAAHEAKHCTVPAEPIFHWSKTLLQVWFNNEPRTPTSGPQAWVQTQSTHALLELVGPRTRASGFLADQPGAHDGRAAGA